MNCVLAIDTSDSKGAYIRFRTNNTWDADVGRWSNGVWIQNAHASLKQQLGIKDDGTLVFEEVISGGVNSYKVYHEGYAFPLDSDSAGYYGNMKLYAEYSNEVNFGGSYNSGTIYFSYRAKDSKPLINKFIFGNDTTQATLCAASFVKKDGT